MYGFFQNEREAAEMVELRGFMEAVGFFFEMVLSSPQNDICLNRVEVEWIIGRPLLFFFPR